MFVTILFVVTIILQFALNVVIAHRNNKFREERDNAFRQLNKLTIPGTDSLLNKYHDIVHWEPGDTVVFKWKERDEKSYYDRYVNKTALTTYCGLTEKGHIQLLWPTKDMKRVKTYDITSVEESMENISLAERRMTGESMSSHMITITQKVIKDQTVHKMIEDRLKLELDLAESDIDSDPDLIESFQRSGIGVRSRES